MNKYTLCLIYCLFSTIAWLQTGQVVEVLDAQTNETMAFVKVLQKDREALFTDIDGKVELPLNSGDRYLFRFFNYQDTTLSAEQIKSNTTIYLKPDAQDIEEVVIVAGENRAHRIIRNAMRERKNNDPLRNNSFEYKSFSKFYLSGEPTEPINRDTVTDTTLLKDLELLDEQYFFLTETGATRIFSPPSYDKEVVHSYKVSGVKNPLFATLVNQFQSFSFYENMFSINGKDYINPIAAGGIRRYMFILQDTVVRGIDSTFTIQFKPRQGKNFEGLKGYLYINTNGWAIEKVIAEPYESSNLKIKTIQEYKFTAEKKWFPEKLSTEFEMPGIMLGEYHYAVGKSNLYIDDVEFDIPINKRFNAIRLEVADNAVDDTLGLDKARGAKSTEKERKTYAVIDSIGEELNLDRMVDAFSILTTGKIPIGKLSFPINRIIAFNQQEGYRLGLGAETNTRFSKHVKFGGYFAYGFRDKQWKWGGLTEFTLHQKRQIKLSLKYSDDVFERGGVDFNKDEFDLTSGESYRTFFVNQLDRERKASVGLQGLITPNFKLQLIGNYRRFQFFDDYAFVPLFDNINATSTGFDVAETGFIVNWNIREKVMMLGERRVSLGTKYPKIVAKAVRGWNSIFDGAYEYYRFNLGIEQNFSIRGFGKLQLQSVSGATVGNAPLVLQQLPYGTGVNWSITVPNTFETMLPAEFFSERQTTLFTRFTFLPLKNKTDWTEPLFSIHNAAGFGQMDNRAAHFNNDFKVHDEGYFETGIIVDNLLKFGFNGFGIGVFHRYGPYAFDDLKDNFVYKLSVQFNF